jgi:hypothetical protein
MEAAVIEAAILRLVAECGVEKSISPSDVAITLGEPWQSHLKAVRAAAVTLAKAGRLQVLRKGKPVEDFGASRGVIRLRAVRGM